MVRCAAGLIISNLPEATVGAGEKTLRMALDHPKLETVRGRDGYRLLGTDLTDFVFAKLRDLRMPFTPLTAAAQVFKVLHDLATCPLYHPRLRRLRLVCANAHTEGNLNR